MKSLVLKFRDVFKDQKIYYLMVLLFFCVGIVLGVYAVKYMNITDRQDLTLYYTEFIDSLNSRPIDYGILLIDVIKKNLLLLLPIILLGFIFWGAPITLVIDLLKGFSIGYTFTFLLTTFDGKGLWLAIISLLPQNIIYIPCILAISILSLSLSTNKFKERFIKRNVKKTSTNKGLANILIILLCIFILGVVIEAYISPNLIKMVVTKFY